MEDGGRRQNKNELSEEEGMGVMDGRRVISGREAGTVVERRSM